MKDLFLGGKDGLYGAFHTYVGEEAVAVGAMGSLNDDDYIASTHRGHGHLIAKGGDLNKMSAEIFFKASGYNKGYGGSMHITDMSKGIMGMNGIVGASYYMAAGAAIRARVRNTKQVGVAFFGDGASASPYYFSAVRSCANHKIPVIFVNENNFQYMGVPMAFTVPTKYIREYTQDSAFRISWSTATTSRRCTPRRRKPSSGRGPGKGRRVIEGDHLSLVRPRRLRRRQVGQDAAMGLPYRSDEEVRQWMSRDPQLRFKTWILAKGLAHGGRTLGRSTRRTRPRSRRRSSSRRKSADPTPEAGVLNTYAKGAAAATQFYNRKGARPQPD